MAALDADGGGGKLAERTEECFHFGNSNMQTIEALVDRTALKSWGRAALKCPV